MIPLLKEGAEPPQGLSYKKRSGAYCLFYRVQDQMVRIEISKKFPWIGVATHHLEETK